MKITSRITIAILLAALATVGAQQPPQSKEAKIPVETIKQFWQADDAQRAAQQALKDAQTAAQAANTDWQAAVKALNDACGNDYRLAQDAPWQDPYCDAKPPAPAPAGK
jgi:hypothetical protein